MDTGDTLALIAGLAIVVFVAVMANPGSLSALKNPFKTAETTPESNPIVQIPVADTPRNAGPLPVITTIPAESHLNLSRIVYTDKPYTYPSYRIPENMETFGASEVPLKTLEWVPFAYIENSRGGLTEFFSVPYPVWVINTTVIAKNHPQYAVFRMALCYADTGGIIDGEEILNQGTSYRIVQTSNTGMYMIINTENIDSYRITLETTRKYYDAFSSS